MEVSLIEAKQVVRHKEAYKNSCNVTPICPVCKDYLSYGWKFKHCPNCGQLLYWGNVKP